MDVKSILNDLGIPKTEAASVGVAVIQGRPGLRVLVGRANKMEGRPGGGIQYELADINTDLIEWPTSAEPLKELLKEVR